MKHCTRCDRTLSRDSFNANKKNKDGLQVWCKECYRDYYLASKTADESEIETTDRLSFWQDEPFELSDRHKMILLISDIELDLLKLRRLINESGS